MLDNNHRLQVHDKADKRWCDIDATLEVAHLKKRDYVANNSMAAYKPALGAQSSAKRGFQGAKRGVCYAYNSAEGCPFSKDRCRYEHTESDRTLRASGGQEKAPRFQTIAERTVIKP